MGSKINPEQLRALLEYNPETGELTWKPRPASMFPAERYCRSWNTRYAGREAFKAIDGSGYLRGRVVDGFYSAHRVAWAIFYGKWPRNEIDHINGVITDNRIENLRDATRAENSHNLKLPSKNSSGEIGISWRKASRKWQVRVRHAGKNIYLGMYTDIQSAVSARNAGLMRFGFHQNHGRSAARQGEK